MDLLYCTLTSQDGVLHLRKRPMHDDESMKRMNTMRIHQAKDKKTKYAILEHAERR